MKICVWRPHPKHEIAAIVADAVLEGLAASGNPAMIYLDADEVIPDDADIHIGYGILRGIGDVMKECQQKGKPFFHIDRGYWKPGHYDGYYRISLCGTQQTIGLDKLEPDYERLDKLEVEILPEVKREGAALICPPTDYVADWLGLKLGAWGMPTEIGESVIEYRHKGTITPLQTSLDRVAKVITFNSSVGWEALRQGIPVFSDSTHSIVGAYQKLVDKPLHLDINERRKLFGIQASLQLTLDEIRQGMIWPLLQRLMKFT